MSSPFQIWDTFIFQSISLFYASSFSLQLPPWPQPVGEGSDTDNHQVNFQRYHCRVLSCYEACSATFCSPLSGFHFVFQNNRKFSLYSFTLMLDLQIERGILQEHKGEKCEAMGGIRGTFTFYSSYLRWVSISPHPRVKY